MATLWTRWSRNLHVREAGADSTGLRLADTPYALAFPVSGRLLLRVNRPDWG